MNDNYWLEAKNISCIKNGYEIVKDLNLKLKYGENVILIGPNGSGKSSILELINRTIYPVIKRGTVFKIFNDEHINIWELRKKISVVNCDVKTRINPKLKVLDLIISGLYGLSQNRQYNKKRSFIGRKAYKKNGDYQYISKIFLTFI